MTQNKQKKRKTASSPVRLKDVADHAGVSIATVSRVLNQPDLVRASLRERVTQAVNTLSYTRDGIARALKSGHFNTIGAVVPTLSVSVFATGVEALQNRLSEHGYTLLLANSQYDPRKELQEVRSLIEHGIDGLVLVGTAGTPELYDFIEKRDIPTLSTYVITPVRNIPVIGIDNEQAGYEVARYLLSLEHRELGIIVNAMPTNDRAQARKAGILRALRDANIELQPSQIIEAGHFLGTGRMAMRQLLENHPHTTAVICTTDPLAFGALAEAKLLGRSVPRDLSITGFDDVELASHIDPPLTTIHIPAIEMGRGAADHLVNAIQGLPTPPVTTLPAHLVLRGTTGRAPHSPQPRPAKA